MQMKNILIFFSLIPTLLFGQQNIKQVTTVGNNAGSNSIIGLSLVGLRGATSGTVTVQGPSIITTYTFTLPSDDGASGQFLQTDGNGVSSWQTISSPTDWHIVGNLGTTAGTNFVGTTDNQAVVIKANSNEITRFYPYGQMSLGNSGQAPNQIGNSLFIGSGAGLNFRTAPNYSGVRGDSTIGIGVGALASSTGDRGSIAIGYNALNKDICGSNNIMIGLNAGANITTCASGTGDSNIGIGGNALASHTSPNGELAIGQYALSSENGVATNNSAIGFECMYKNLTGTDNTATGPSSMRENTSGSYNTAYGESSLQNNLTTNYNTAVGWKSLFTNIGSENTAVGYASLDLNTTGSDNTAIGHRAGLHNTNASDNTYLGAYAGETNSNGVRNVYIGSLSGNIETSSYNNAIGYNSMGSASGSTKNCAFGYGTLQNTGDQENVAVGHLAGNSTTAGFNTYLGAESGQLNTSGNYNVGLGFFAGHYGITLNHWFYLNLNGDQTNITGDTATTIVTARDGGSQATRRINFNGHVRIQDGTQGSGKVLTSDANGYSSWQAEGQLLHAISTPTTSATVTLTNNYINIVNPSGTIAALTINFPNSPSNNDFVEVTFDQIITSVTYVAGTGGATIKGQINGIVGGQKRWDYDTGTNTWY